MQQRTNSVRSELFTLLAHTLHGQIWQFLVIYDELIMNYIMALVAVAVLSVFILGRWKIVALVCFTVVRQGSASTSIQCWIERNSRLKHPSYQTYSRGHGKRGRL